MRKIIAAFLLVSPLFGATYYVDSSVATNGNGLSWATAWKNLGNITGVHAGDTIYISGGPSASSQNYSVPTTFWTPAGGTSGSPITYAVGQDNSHNGTVIINTTFAHWLNPSGTFGGWVTFNGNDGYGNAHMMASVTGTGLTSEWVVMSNVSGITFQYINFPRNDAFNFANVNQYDIDHCIMEGKVDHAMKITGTPVATAYGVNVIHDNYILMDQDSGGSGLGIDGIQSASSVDIYNNVCMANPTTYTGTQHQDCWQTFTGAYSRFYNNIAAGMANSGVYLEPESNMSNVQVFNNILYSPTNLHAGGLQEGIQITAQAGGWTITNILVANNTITDVGNKCLYAPQQNGVIFNSTVQFVNNVCYNTPIIITGTGITQTTNYATNSGGSGLWISYQPPTATPFKPNFALPSTSALVAAGTNLTSGGAFTTDFVYRTRPSSAAWAIGAYEFFPTGTKVTGTWRGVVQ